MTLRDLPTLNATLNAVSATFLIAGYLFIRSRRIRQHRACMLTAFGASVLFLVGYLTYHYLFGSTKFVGEGWTRGLYFSVLLSHTILAATVAPLAIVTLSRALSCRFDKHRVIARWTLPIWLYVSVTGVLVYFMLYHWFVPEGAGKG